MFSISFPDCSKMKFSTRNFLLKRFYLGITNFFVFAKIFNCKGGNSWIRVVNNNADTQFTGCFPLFCKFTIKLDTVRRRFFYVLFSHIFSAAYIKGTVSRDFWPFFATKIRPGPHMNRQKRFRELFLCCVDIAKTCVFIVNDYTDTVLA